MLGSLAGWLLFILVSVLMIATESWRSNEVRSMREKMIQDTSRWRKENLLDVASTREEKTRVRNTLYGIRRMVNAEINSVDAELNSFP